MLCGICVLLVWLAGRSHQVPGIHVASGLSITAVLLATAGFVGARHSGSVIGGLWTGCMAAGISSLAVPGDAVLFHLWFSDSSTFACTMFVAVGIVLSTVAIGAVGAGFGRHQLRIRRSARAFAAAWSQPA